MKNVANKDKKVIIHIEFDSENEGLSIGTENCSPIEVLGLLAMAKDMILSEHRPSETIHDILSKVTVNGYKKYNA